MGRAFLWLACLSLAGLLVRLRCFSALPSTTPGLFLPGDSCAAPVDGDRPRAACSACSWKPHGRVGRGAPPPSPWISVSTSGEVGVEGSLAGFRIQTLPFSRCEASRRLRGHALCLKCVSSRVQGGREHRDVWGQLARPQGSGGGGGSHRPPFLQVGVAAFDQGCFGLPHLCTPRSHPRLGASSAFTRQPFLVCCVRWRSAKESLGESNFSIL